MTLSTLDSGQQQTLINNNIVAFDFFLQYTSVIVCFCVYYALQ